MSEKMPESEGSGLGEKIAIDKLIVMDDASGLADRCEDFSNFLTVSRKYGFSCVYVFHTIYPGRQSWEMIMSQTHIFDFFPGSVHSGRILKTLSLFASRERNTYVPTNQIWLNRLYFQISNSKFKICLTIDTRDTNDFGSGKFRTRADSGQEQHCYFNRLNTDSRFKCFLAKRVFTEQDRPVFTIVEQNYCLTTDEKTYKSSSNILLHSTTTDGRTSEQVKKLIEKTTMTESDPRLLKDEEVEIDPWMQPSQPLPESGYNSSASDQEQETKETTAATRQRQKQKKATISFQLKNQLPKEKRLGIRQPE